MPHIAKGWLPDSLLYGIHPIAGGDSIEPDGVILDLALPQMNGLQAAEEISARYPLIAIVLLTVQEVSSALVKEAQRVGFRGAISKSTGTEVVKGVETMLRGQSFFKLSSSDMADPGL